MEALVEAPESPSEPSPDELPSKLPSESSSDPMPEMDGALIDDGRTAGGITDAD